MAAGGPNTRMTADRDQWAESLSAGHQGGWLTSFLAEEEPLNWRGKWRLASWGVGAVGALTVAILASQTTASLRREQLASTDLMDRQAKQIQLVASESETESKRLSAAISTLNSDRDRLFARVTSVEQGLESITSSVKHQAAPSSSSQPGTAQLEPLAAAQKPGSTAHSVTAPAVTSPAAALLIGPVASGAPAETPAPKPAVPPTTLDAPAPLMASKSIMAPPDSAASKLNEPVPPNPAPAPVAPVAVAVASAPASASPEPERTASIEPPTAKPESAPPAKNEVASIPVQRTEFGVDLGGANSVDGLRALWRGLTASNKSLANLRPIITIRERSNGYSMQLRLVAGPLDDAAAAAKLCAVLKLGERTCETSIFDGQRLALKNESPAKTDTLATAATAKPAPARRRPIRIEPKREPVVEQTVAKPPEEPPPPPRPTGLSSILGIAR